MESALSSLGPGIVFLNVSKEEARNGFESSNATPQSEKHPIEKQEFEMIDPLEYNFVAIDEGRQTNELEIEQRPMDSDIENNVVKGESTWTTRNVFKFLAECQKRKQDILNPKIRRRVVFTQIQKVLRESGICFKSSNLEIKLKNLKIRYTKIFHRKLQAQRNRHVRSHWPFYDMLDNIYGEALRFKYRSLHSNPEVSIDQVRVSNLPTMNSLPPALPNGSNDFIEHTTAANTASSEPSPSNARTLTGSTRSPNMETKLLAIEEKKLAIAKEFLQEIKEMRLLKQQHFDFIKEKYYRNESEDDGQLV